METVVRSLHLLSHFCAVSDLTDEWFKLQTLANRDKCFNHSILKVVTLENNAEDKNNLKIIMRKQGEKYEKLYVVSLLQLATRNALLGYSLINRKFDVRKASLYKNDYLNLQIQPYQPNVFDISRNPHQGLRKLLYTNTQITNFQIYNCQNKKKIINWKINSLPKIYLYKCIPFKSCFF